MAQRLYPPDGRARNATSYDRDTETIEPLVPIMPGNNTSEDGYQEYCRGSLRTESDENMMVHQSELTYTTEYTWDVEMIEPGVPRL